MTFGVLWPRSSVSSTVRWHSKISTGLSSAWLAKMLRWFQMVSYKDNSKPLIRSASRFQKKKRKDSWKVRCEICNQSISRVSLRLRKRWNWMMNNEKPWLMPSSCTRRQRLWKRKRRWKEKCEKKQSSSQLMAWSTLLNCTPKLRPLRKKQKFTESNKPKVLLQMNENWI